MYAAARATRNTAGFGQSGDTSADSELWTSLTALRARARQMVRDSSYAKRAKRLVVDNVIGSGVGLQSQVLTNAGDLNERVNSDIESAFAQWAGADSCHTGGKLHFHDIERTALGQIFEAGEVIIRMHFRRFGGSKIPFGLELIEPERMAHDATPLAANPDADVRMGVESDKFGRPLAYWIREQHPGDVRGRPGQQVHRFERVEASEIFHLYRIDRWPQTRGEPWLHTTLRKLDEMNELTALELAAARGGAAYFATITTDAEDAPTADEEEDDGTQVMDLQPLTTQRLNPGEELQFHTPNRPNAALDGFMRMMLREICAGAGPSYASVSCDYSQSNYSSSRIGMLDERDFYRTIQSWWVRAFRQPLHKVWLQQAVLAGALSSVPVSSYGVTPQKYEAAIFKLRGWSWVDPTKEVKAYKEAVLGGMTTLSDVIAATSGGLDIEDFVKTRARELKLLRENGIPVDTTFIPGAATAPAGETPAQDIADDAAAEDAEATVEGEGSGGASQTGRVVSIARTA